MEGVEETEVQFSPTWTGKVVVLDRILDEDSEPLPDYCVHGRTTCIHCKSWVWLGSETIKLVLDGKAAPLCLECAAAILSGPSSSIGNAGDHKRADGPHE